MRELQLVFRQKMALMLQDPQGAAQNILDRKKSWPATTQAVNWLIGEHMLQKGCCFALSVFKTEAPLLEDLPLLDDRGGDKRHQQQLVIPQLTLERVLQEVGFRRGEQQFLALHADYRANRGSLLECVVVHSKKVREIPISYYRKGLLILDHSYLVGKLTNSEIADTKVLGF
jgi:hypothetical protein